MTLVYGCGDTATSCRRVWGLLRLKVADQHTGRQGDPRFWPPRLGPRSLTNSVVNSLGGIFVWVLWLAHQVRSVIAETPLADSKPSDHDSPNAPAPARSVYVIAHPAARPTRHGPRFSGLLDPILNRQTVRLKGGPRITDRAHRTMGALVLGA
jgi:hypothetical protein